MAEFVDQIPQQPGLAFEEKTHQYILNGMQVYHLGNAHRGHQGAG